MALVNVKKVKFYLKSLQMQKLIRNFEAKFKNGGYYYGKTDQRNADIVR